jgi:hypothetical protein
MEEDFGWKHNQLDTKISYISCNHIFTQMEENKVKTSSIIIKLSTAQKWVHNLLYIKFEKL